MAPEPRSSRRVFEGRFIQVDVERWPAGEREVVKHPGASAVVAVTPEGHVLLVKQFRESVRREVLEIPAGIIGKGESAERCAARELLEETGHRAVDLEHLGAIYTSPGFTDERIELFFAGARPSTQPAGDQLEVIELPVLDAAPAIRSGRITDAKTVAALLLSRSAKDWP